MRDEPLDMRMNPEWTTTAEELVNGLDAKALTRIFLTYGEERWAARIADRIVSDRRVRRIQTSRRLAEIITAAVPTKAAAKQRIHPATRVFMALRIAVNKELDVLSCFLDRALDCLNPKGRLCILSFHSLEDREVKNRMKDWSVGCTCPKEVPICVCGKTPKARLLTRKVARPSAVEVEHNPLSRSKFLSGEKAGTTVTHRQERFAIDRPFKVKAE